MKLSLIMEFNKFSKGSEVEPASGTFLIAEPFLEDPGFSRTVIFLCEHGAYGTLGFVLNRPSTNSVDMLLPELDFPGVKIFNGGPVQTDSIQILHQMPEYLSGVEVVPGVFWGASYDELVSLSKLGIKIPPSKIRMFRGYSGWDAGQLENELNYNSWFIAPADKELIFETDSKKTWVESLKFLGSEFTFFANLPLNPMWN